MKCVDMNIILTIQDKFFLEDRLLRGLVLLCRCYINTAIGPFTVPPLRLMGNFNELP
jgi:hypothetical protein